MNLSLKLDICISCDSKEHSQLFIITALSDSNLL